MQFSVSSGVVELPRYVTFGAGVAFMGDTPPGCSVFQFPKKREALDIGIDLDDTAYPMLDALRGFLRHRLHRNFSPPVGWDLPTQFGLEPDEFYGLFEEFVIKHNGFGRAYPVEGFSDTLDWLQARGHRVHFVTARACNPKSSKQFRQITKAQTAQWLEYQNAGHLPLTFTDDKTSVRLDVLVDDGIHNLEAAKKKGTTAIAYSAPHNASWEGQRISRFKQLQSAILLEEGKNQWQIN